MAFAVIVTPVTGVAVFRCVLVTLVGMTGVTFGRQMSALERELCAAVIKTRLLPCAVYMAAHAFLTQLALVNIVLLVAGIALRGRLPVLEIRLVALLAPDLGVSVSASQRIVRQGMVKGFHIQGCDILISSLMFRVTGVALLPLDTAVVTAAFDDILGHVPVIVTVETKFGLSRFLERCMTVSAFAL